MWPFSSVTRMVCWPSVWAAVAVVHCRPVVGGGAASEVVAEMVVLPIVGLVFYTTARMASRAIRAAPGASETVVVSGAIGRGRVIAAIMGGVRRARATRLAFLAIAAGGSGPVLVLAAQHRFGGSGGGDVRQIAFRQ